MFYRTAEGSSHHSLRNPAVEYPVCIIAFITFTRAVVLLGKCSTKPHGSSNQEEMRNDANQLIAADLNWQSNKYIWDPGPAFTMSCLD